MLFCVLTIGSIPIGSWPSDQRSPLNGHLRQCWHIISLNLIRSTFLLYRWGIQNIQRCSYDSVRMQTQWQSLHCHQNLKPIVLKTLSTSQGTSDNSGPWPIQELAYSGPFPQEHPTRALIYQIGYTEPCNELYKHDQYICACQIAEDHNCRYGRKPVLTVLHHFVINIWQLDGIGNGRMDKDYSALVRRWRCWCDNKYHCFLRAKQNPKDRLSLYFRSHISCYHKNRLLRTDTCVFKHRWSKGQGRSRLQECA